MIVEMDVTLECLDAFRALLAKLEIRVDRFVQVGPGGGNPMFVLTVDEKWKMQGLIDFYWG